MKTLDLRPTEEECVNMAVLDCYNRIKHYNWLIVIIEVTGEMIYTNPGANHYLDRIIRVIDRFLESEMGSTTIIKQL